MVEPSIVVRNLGLFRLPSLWQEQQQFTLHNLPIILKMLAFAIWGAIWLGGVVGRVNVKSVGGGLTFREIAFRVFSGTSLVSGAVICSL